VELQFVLDTRKLVDAAIVIPMIDFLPLSVSLIVCELLVLPISTLPKEMLAGSSVTVDVPLPVKGTVRHQPCVVLTVHGVPLLALLDITSEPLAEPTALGVNVSVYVHFFFGWIAKHDVFWMPKLGGGDGLSA
jgi:hypothetical protein